MRYFLMVYFVVLLIILDKIKAKFLRLKKSIKSNDQKHDGRYKKTHIVLL